MMTPDTMMDAYRPMVEGASEMADPVLLIVGEEGIGIAVMHPSDEVSVPNMVRAIRADFVSHVDAFVPLGVGLMAEVWATSHPLGTVGEVLRPRDDPHRIDAVSLMYFGRDGRSWSQIIPFLRPEPGRVIWDDPQIEDCGSSGPLVEAMMEWFPPARTPEPGEDG